MRSLALLVAVAAAYLLLRGHPESWSELLRACLAVVMLVAGLGCWAVSRRGGLPVLASRRRAMWVDSVVLGSVVLAVEVGFVAWFRVTPAPLEEVATKFEAWLRPEVSARRRIEEQRAAQARGGNWLWNHEGRRPLPRRTNFKPGNRPEVFLRPTDGGGSLLEQKIYVHAFAMGEYHDGAWSPGGGGERVRVAGNDGWVRFGAERSGATVSFRVFLGGDPDGQNPLVGVQGMAAARLPELRERAPDFLLLPEVADGGYEYDTVSQPRMLDEVDAGAVAGGGLDGRYLALPTGEMGRRIGRFTEVVSGEGSVVERLQRVRNHLRTTLDYSLVTDNPKDRDPLENFLFDEQRGHCEFFATAGALLARTLGVPSRICYGWTGGTYYEGSQLFVFRAREAHAWAEVWLEGEGWVVFDPTPPSAFLHGRPELAPPEASPPGLEVAAESGPTDEGGDGLPWLLGLVGLLALPPLLLRPLRRGRAGEGEWVAGIETGSYVRDFGAACRRRGVRCFPGRTLKSMVGVLDDRPEFAVDMLGYHYAVRYEGARRDRETERRLVARIREWDSRPG